LQIVDEWMTPYREFFGAASDRVVDRSTAAAAIGDSQPAVVAGKNVSSEKKSKRPKDTKKTKKLHKSPSESKTTKKSTSETQKATKRSAESSKARKK
jgi:hypothetical protein